MRYQTPAAFRAALEQRLQTRARQGALSLSRLRKAVVFDRLLARLFVVAPDRWILNGGVALYLRLEDRARTTGDLDLARQDATGLATDDLLTVQETDLGDHFVFVVRQVANPSAALDGTSLRFHVTAELDGRPFERIVVDVGLGDPFVELPDILPGLNLLEFAGFAPIGVPTLPIEQHVAEKVHAYSRSYGHRSNTRVKDLVDLVLIQAAAAFDAGVLRHGLQAVFASRGTHPLPTALPPPPPEWTTGYRALAEEVRLDPDVSVGYRLAAAFLDPVMDPVMGGTLGIGARWDAGLGRWQPGEPD